MGAVTLRILQVASRDRFGGEAARVACGLHAAYPEQPGVDARMLVRRKFSVAPRVDGLPRQSTGWARDRLLDLGSRLQLQSGRIRGAWRAGRALELLAEPRRLWYRAAGFEAHFLPGSRRLLELSPERPDIVQIHDLESCVDPAILPRLSRTLPVVLNVHEPAALRSLEEPTPSARRPSARRPSVRRVTSLLRRSSLHLAAASGPAMEAALSALPAGAVASHRVVPFGVDRTVFRRGNAGYARASLRLPPETRVIVASFDDGDRDGSLALLRKALAGAATESAGGPEVLAIGVGIARPREWAASIEIRCLHYPKDPETIACWLQAAELYLHLSAPSAFPLAIVEALSCGVPVVAPAAGGVTEQIDDGVEGLLAPAGDAGALASHVRRLLSDRTLRDRLGRQAADRAARQFEIGRTAESFVEWFQDLTSKRNEP